MKLFLKMIIAWAIGFCIGTFIVNSFAKAEIESHFNTGSSVIATSLDKHLVEFYNKNIEGKKAKLIELRVIGHTDVRGELGYNLRLSIARAAAVKARLVELGVDEKKIIAQGEGEAYPIAKGNTLDDHAQNRRIQLIVKYTNGLKTVVISEKQKKDCKCEPKGHKNRVSLIAGYGNLGTLDESRSSRGVRFETEQGLVMGLQYMRDVKVKEDYSIHLGVQVQTNKTFSVMGGIGF